MKELARKAVLCRDLSHRWGWLEERGPNGELLARHVHGPSVDDLVLSELSGAVYYYHHDHLNSTIAVTDESGAVVEQYRYDVYGQPFFYGANGAPRSDSALGIRFLFTGREWLGSVGLYDYRHRIYSPSLGRFLQLDALGLAPEGVNLYAYCSNVPLILVDPFGLCESRPPNYEAMGKAFALAAGAELIGIGIKIVILGFPEVAPLALVGALPFFVSGAVFLHGACTTTNGNGSPTSKSNPNESSPFDNRFENKARPTSSTKSIVHCDTWQHGVLYGSH